MADLGELIVKIGADAKEFRSEVDAIQKMASKALGDIKGEASLKADISDAEKAANKAEAALDGIEGEAELGADISDAETAASEADAMLDGIEGEAALGADISAAEAGAAEADALLDGIEGTAMLGADVSEIEGASAAAQAMLDAIEGTASLGADVSEVEGAASSAQSMLDGIEGVASLGVDISDLEGAASSAQAMLDGIEATASLGVDTSEVDGAVASAQAALDGIEGRAPGMDMGAGFTEGSTMAVGGLAGVSGGIKGIAGAAAAIGVGKIFTGMWSDAKEAVQEMAKLEQQVKVTGASAWTSADEIDELANSIQSVTGISDETIKSNASLLLSFKDVKNEVGQGNDVFDRAIGAATDLSTVLGTDMKGATTMLGKALNDPLKGISALGRAGVQFSASQQEMIKGLVETGDLLGAQTIILGEVEGQVGGAAEAMATGGDLLKASLGDLSEAMGMTFFPILDGIVKLAVPVVDFFAALPGPIQMIVVAIPALVAGLAAIGVVAPLVATGLNTVGISGVFAGKGVLAAMAPMAPILLAIGAVIAIGYLLVKNWDTIKVVAGAVWGFVENVISGAVDWIIARWQTMMGWVATLIGHWETFKVATALIWDAVLGKARSVVDFFASIPGRIGGAFSGLAQAITAPFRTAFGAIKSLWNSTIGRLSFSIPSWVPGIGGRGFSMPHLAQGGTVTGSGFALVGERGPERVWLGEGARVEPLERSPSLGPSVVVQASALLGTERDVIHWVRKAVGV